MESNLLFQSNSFAIVLLVRFDFKSSFQRIAFLQASPNSFGYEPHLLVADHNQVGLPKCAKFVGNLTRRETIQLISESDVGIGHMYPTNTVPRKVVEYLALGKMVILAICFS